eukprot:gene11294-11444_t
MVMLEGATADVVAAACNNADVSQPEGPHMSDDQQVASLPLQLDSSIDAGAGGSNVASVHPALTAAAAAGPTTAAPPAAAEPKYSDAEISQLLPAGPKLPVQKLPLFLQVSYLRDHGFLPYEDGTWSRQDVAGAATGLAPQPAAAATTNAINTAQLHSSSKRSNRVHWEDSKVLVHPIADVQPAVHESRSYAPSTDRGKLWEEHLLTLRMIHLELSAVEALQQVAQQLEQLNQAFASRPCLSCKTKRPTCYNACSDLLPLWREHQLNLQVILHHVSSSPQAVSLVQQTVDRCFNRRCIRCMSASPGSHCGKGTFFCGNCMRVFGRKQQFSEEACWQAVKEGRAVDPNYKRGKS